MAIAASKRVQHCAATTSVPPRAMHTTGAGDPGDGQKKKIASDSFQQSRNRVGCDALMQVSRAPDNGQIKEQVKRGGWNIRLR